jgi:hypothetical protein
MAESKSPHEICSQEITVQMFVDWQEQIGILRRLKKESLPRSQFFVFAPGENRRYALQRRFFQADDRNGIIFVPEILI